MYLEGLGMNRIVIATRIARPRALRMMKRVISAAPAVATEEPEEVHEARERCLEQVQDLGIGLGGALVPLVAVWLTRMVGWQGALKILGVAIIVIALPLALFVKEAPPTAGASARASDEPHVSLRTVFRSPAFYFLLLGSMCSIAAVGGTNQHLKLFLSIDRGFTQGDAAKVASLVLMASLVGRLAAGWLADHMRKKYVMIFIYLLVLAGIPLLFLGTESWTVTAFAVVFGLGLGGEYMIIPLMAAELFGVRVLGRAMGIILTADGVAEALAPVVVGRLRDSTGSYDTGFLVLIGFAIAGALAIAMLPRARKSAPSMAVAAESA